VYEKSFGMRHFRTFPSAEKAGLAPSQATGLAREEQDEENGSNGGGQIYDGGGPGAILKILRCMKSRLKSAAYGLLVAAEGKTDHLPGGRRVPQDGNHEDYGSHGGPRVYNEWCPGGHGGNPEQYFQGLPAASDRSEHEPHPAAVVCNA